MKSFCTAGLVLLAGLSWAAGQANAQSGDNGRPSLLPLPRVAPASSELRTASYNAYSPSPTLAQGPKPAEPFSSSFNNRAQTQAPPEESAPSSATSFDDALHAPCWDDCDSCNAGCAKWFGAVGGLVMTRNRANPYWTTFQTNNNPNQLMNTQNAGAGWSGGGQITVGYGFCGCSGCGDCCGGCGSGGPGIAVTYWSLADMNGFSQVTDQTGNINTALSTPIDLGGVFIGANPASAFFDNAHQQKIWRSDSVQNFEINVLQGQFYNNGYLQVVGLAGFRYFRFDETLTYGSVAFGSNFGDNGGANEAYLKFRTVNNLYGVQVGALINTMLTNRLGVFFIPKAGLFGNQMVGRTQLYSGDGITSFDIKAYKSDVSFLGEVDTGINYAITPSVRAFIGYRVIGIANVALADNQFLPFLADAAGFAQVKQSGALIMHGGFAGLAWAF